MSDENKMVDRHEIFERTHENEQQEKMKKIWQLNEYLFVGAEHLIDRSKLNIATIMSYDIF